jgi:hypothetical protein
VNFDQPGHALVRVASDYRFQAGQEPSIGVAHDRWDPAVPECMDDLSRLRPSLKGVSQADDSVQTLSIQLGKDRFQGDAVAMNVSDDAKSHQV